MRSATLLVVALISSPVPAQVNGAPPELAAIIREADQLIRTNPGFGSKWAESFERMSARTRAYLADIPDANLCFWLEGLDLLLDLSIDRFSRPTPGVTVRTHEARAKLEALKQGLDKIRQVRCRGPGGKAALEAWGKEMTPKLQGKRWKSRDFATAYVNGAGVMTLEQAGAVEPKVAALGALTLLLLATPLPGDETVTLAMLAEALAL